MTTDFRTIFRSKISELESEIQRLKYEIDSNQQYIALNRTVEDLRNELEDYNMARMNSFCDVNELKKEIDDLHAHNEQLESIINKLYLEKQKKEERIQQLDENEIITVENQLNTIRHQTSNSIIQQEALSLIDQIFELEFQYDQLSNFEFEEDESIEKLNETLKQYSDDIQNTQKTNLSLLSFISRTLITSNSSQLKINFDQYEIEKQNSIDTLTILSEQHRKLKQEFIKLEKLDAKLINELQELKIQFIKLQNDIAKFNDLETLKHQAERRKHQLTTDKINMTKQKHITQIEIQSLQSQFESLRTQLQDNLTHQQLVHLEEKLQSVSRILFSLDGNEVDYDSIKNQVLTLVHAHNQWLIEQLKPSS